jgi:hypothetical protein
MTDLVVFVVGLGILTAYRLCHGGHWKEQEDYE